MEKRDYRFDNLKGILIFLAVFAHFLEIFYGSGLKTRIYYFIYTFHMPVFVFVSGYFARFDFKNILSKLLYPYIIFQVLYCVFLGEKIQFLKPAWLLWYLFCLTVWYLSLKIFNRFIPAVTGFFVILSLTMGFVNSVGYQYSLSRLIYFYPFFLTGFYARQKNFKPFKLSLGLILLSVSVALSACVTFFVHNKYALYGSVSYQTSDSSLFLRLSLYAVAFLWIFSLLNTVPSFKIPFVSDFGRYSVCIFLLHGFIVKANLIPLAFGTVQNILLSLIMSFLLCIVLGNRYIFQFLQPVFKLPLQTDKNVVKYNGKN